MSYDRSEEKFERQSGRDSGEAGEQAFRNFLRMGATEMPFSGFEEDVMRQIEIEEALLEQKPAIFLRLSSFISLMIGVIAGFVLAGYIGGIEHLYIFTGEQLSTGLQVLVVLMTLLQLDRIFTLMKGGMFRSRTQAVRR